MSKTFNKQSARQDTLREKYLSQPYEVTIDNVHLLIEKDVFPPDLGYTTLEMSKCIRRYSGESALDVGCGCGILALAMYQSGFKHIWGIERHPPAYHCAKHNVINHKAGKVISILFGDLFQPIENLTVKFDLIVFNHPFFPSIGKRVFGDDPDGGKEVLEKFFIQSKKFLHPCGKILVPHSEIAGDMHNAKFIAEQQGFHVQIISCFELDGFKQYIYEVSLT